MKISCENMSTDRVWASNLVLMVELLRQALEDATYHLRGFATSTEYTIFSLV
jgi:hypothetical protein